MLNLMVSSRLNRSFIRFVSSATDGNKGLLAKLRKKTGFPISSCKKALEINENDATKALLWLNREAQKEGWTRAEKLQGRRTSQGLIGVAVAPDRRLAAMVEVNCETDFVARNDQFRQLVSTVTTACLDAAATETTGEENIVKLTKMSLTSDQLSSLPSPPSTTLADLTALKIGQLGENMTLLRAVVFKLTGDDFHRIDGYVHPPDPSEAASVATGKYGSLVVTVNHRGTSGDVDDDDVMLPVEDCGRQLCQHVVGMNPSCVGETTDERSANPDEETKLIFQEFLLEPTSTVGEFLEQNAVQVADFVRYECGETTTLPDGETTLPDGETDAKP